MVAGFDRYFQIAPCFRDEAGRADRYPGEFYQLDFEMSYVTQEDVFAAIEPVLHGVFEEFAGGRRVSPAPFPGIPYADAILNYASDKPDLRNPVVIRDADPRRSAARDSHFRRHDRHGRECAGARDPGAGRRQPSLLRPDEFLGPGRGPAGSGLHIFS